MNEADKVEHKQGPWAVWPMGRTLVVSCTSMGGKRHPSDGTHIAAVNMPETNTTHDALFMANAKLIAAAPDLLAALIAMNELAKGPTGCVSQTQKREVVASADAAIARATGAAA